MTRSPHLQIGGGHIEDDDPEPLRHARVDNPSE